MICPQCNISFERIWPSTRSKYCSTKCYQTAYRARHKEKLALRLKLYAKENREQVNQAKIKYNKSEKGSKAQASWWEQNKKEVMAKQKKAYKENTAYREAELSRGRATQLLRNFRLRVCEHCGETPKTKRIDCHHKDVNPLNNGLENLQWLCTGCHAAEHARLRKLAKAVDSDSRDYLPQDIDHAH